MLEFYFFTAPHPVTLRMKFSMPSARRQFCHTSEKVTEMSALSILYFKGEVRPGANVQCHSCVSESIVSKGKRFGTRNIKGV